MKYYLAIDIGASSGRHIVGWMESGELKTEEVYRFPNGVTKRDGHLTWDIDALVGHVTNGVRAAQSKFQKIESLSIDTWGVDYVLMKGDEEIQPCYAYRDWRTEAVLDEVHAKMPFSELYRRTGIQFQPFNTIYQLYVDKLAGRLDGATDFLMIPEYLMYKLCGVKSHEYTNATTGGMVSAETGEYDPAILEALGLPKRLFHRLQQPGTVIGEYEGIKVVLCATHDTASAVEGIPMKAFPLGGRWREAPDEGRPDAVPGQDNAPYISSGTWSLLGVKTEKPLTDAASENANWSNEGGVGYNRYQKNIMGMWLVNRLRTELCPDKPWGEIVVEAEASSFDETVDANDDGFLAPSSMKNAFDQALGRVLRKSGESDHLIITNMTAEQIDAWNDSRPPLSVGDYFRCAYRSLAKSYAIALAELEHNTGKHYDKLYIVGGGAKNAFLNRLTEKATGKQVIALPIEATAIGNLKIQMEADQ